MIRTLIFLTTVVSYFALTSSLSLNSIQNPWHPVTNYRAGKSNSNCGGAGENEYARVWVDYCAGPCNVTIHHGYGLNFVSNNSIATCSTLFLRIDQVSNRTKSRLFELGIPFGVEQNKEMSIDVMEWVVPENATLGPCQMQFTMFCNSSTGVQLFCRSIDVNVTK